MCKELTFTSGLCAHLVSQMVKNLPAMQETWVWSLGWKDTLEKGMAGQLPGESQGQKRVVGFMGSQRVWQDWVANTTMEFVKYEFLKGTFLTL